jgi:cell wall-associated NlpC family hydrolase
VALKRYQLTRFGAGFGGRDILGITLLSRRLRRSLKLRTSGELKARVELPDGKVNEFEHLDLKAAVWRNAHALKTHGVGVRVITGSYNYDEPRFATRSVAWDPPPPPEHPFITYGKTWIGHSSYMLGTSGPPPQASDCSGFTMRVVDEVRGVQLVHQADAQMRDPRMWTFRDPAQLQSGDFVWLHYPNSRGLRWDQATHVEFFVSPGTHLGSRPSTNGVNYYRVQSWDYDAILCYGRLK